MSADEPKKQSVKNNDGFQHAPKRASCSFHMDPKEKKVKILYMLIRWKLGYLGRKGKKLVQRWEKNKEGDLADRDSESDVEDNETTCFMTSKISKRISSLKSVGGTRRKSLYEP
nr:hypothetical protein [Tanacetum cinerariifolium]